MCIKLLMCLYKHSLCKFKQVETFCDFVFRLVTPYSKLEFKVFSAKALRSNILIGHHVMDLHPVLEENRGKCKFYKTPYFGSLY